MPNQRRVVLIGPLPEPKGGVSIHVERLIELLETNGWSVSVIDEGRVPKPAIPNLRRLALGAYAKRLWSARISHAHSGNPLIRLFNVAVARLSGRKAILTLHSARERGWAYAATRLAAALSHQRVFVSHEVAARYGGRGHVIPAFLPPTARELTVGADIEAWVARQRELGRKIVVSNASHLALHAGEDLYGLDMLIRAFERRGVRERFSCLFLLSSAQGREAYLEECLARVRALGLEESFWIRLGSENFAGACRLADIAIRATNTDGDSISVREALHLGVATLASDCAVRPPGVLSFRTRDVDDLVRVLLTAEPPRQAGALDGRAILRVYEQALLGTRAVPPMAASC